MIGKKLCQGKNTNKSCGRFYGLFLARKIKDCLTRNEPGIFEERETFKSFTVSKRLLDKSPFFEKLKGNKNHAKPTLSWKKGFVIPKKNIVQCLKKI